jgi:hypothetical protein
VPTISVFYGIHVGMYFDEHPPPHFHVYFGDRHASVAIDTLEIVEGQLPPRA